jgi:hypothetical protein
LTTIDLIFTFSKENDGWKIKCFKTSYLCFC